MYYLIYVKNGRNTNLRQFVYLFMANSIDDYRSTWINLSKIRNKYLL